MLAKHETPLNKIKHILKGFAQMVLVLFTNLTFAQPENDDVELSRFISDSTIQPYVRVMSSPEKFNNKIVTVTGYYLKGTHLNNLFLDEGACMSMDTVNSMILGKELKSEQYKPCERTSVKGTLNYLTGDRGLQNKSDIFLKN